MRAAFAKGRYFNAHIRDRYRFRELSEHAAMRRNRARQRFVRFATTTGLTGRVSWPTTMAIVNVDRTTIVETGGGGGGGGVLAVVLLIIVVLVLLFLFRGQLGFGGDKTEDRRSPTRSTSTSTRTDGEPSSCARDASPCAERARLLSGPRPFEFAAARH